MQSTDGVPARAGAGAGAGVGAGAGAEGPAWDLRRVLAELHRRRAQAWPARPRITLYTLARDPQAHTHTLSGFRIESGFLHPGQQVLSNEWLQDRFPSNTEPRQMTDLQRVQAEAGPGAAGGVGGAGGAAGPAARGARGMESALLGWAAGALLLAALVLLVRAAEKCLDKRLFKRNRRASDEWSRPSVLATSHHHTCLGSVPGLNDPGQGASTDLPPPYCECANKVIINVEEPPPPYSACYVAFTNANDGIPSVHFYNRRRQSILDRAETSNASSDTNTPIVSGDADDLETNSGNEGTNRQLVFENGRIVERDTSNHADSVRGASNAIGNNMSAEGGHVMNIDSDSAREV